MKMTSGRRRLERQGRALDRLAGQTFGASRAHRRAVAASADGVVDMVATEERWKQRCITEIVTLRKRAGRF